MDLVTQYVASSSNIALLGILSALVWRLLVLNERRIERLEADNTWCNQRVSVMIVACQKGGIEIPTIVWDGPPSSRMWKRKRRKTDIPDFDE